MEFIELNLAAGHIRHSSSHIAAGTWMVFKQDPTDMPRVLHDYRALNANTVKDHTPLSRQDEIIESSAKAKVWEKLDQRNAYYGISVHPDDIHKTAFKTSFGMYEWLVMSQGLCNAQQLFNVT